MSKFGHAFDTDFDPNKDATYKLFVEIYKNPLLTKIKEVDGISTFMGKTSCLLINECRYLIAVVSNNTHMVGSQQYLTDLQWDNFQTRTLKGKFECGSCSVLQTSRPSISLELLKRTDKYTQYTSPNLNIKVSLLHTKTNNLYEYPNSGDLFAALDNYQTIISF